MSPSASGDDPLGSAGVRLVGRLDEAPVELATLEVSRAGGVDTLRFRVLE